MQPHAPRALDPDAIGWEGIRSALWGFVLPSMVQQAVATVSNTIVIASIGRLAGVEALAGVSAFFPLLALLLAFLGGIGSGASVLVAQSAGRGEVAQCKAVTGTAVTLAALLGVVVGVAGLVGIAPALHMLGVADRVIAEGDPFARVALLGAPILFVYAVFVIAMQGTGDAWTPMYGAGLQTLLTVLFVPAAIAGWGPVPPLGTAGAAAGLVLATLLAGVGVAGWLTVRRAPLAIDAAFVRGLVPRRSTVAQLLRIGVPSGLNAAMLSISEIVVIGLVARTGTRAMAAYGVVGQIVSYIAIPSSSIAGAASVFGAQAVGRGRPGQLGQIARTAIVVGVLVAVPFAVVIVVQARPLMAWFVQDAATVALGAQLIHIVAWSLPFTLVTQVLAGIMRATRTVLWPTVISVGTVWAVQLPFAIVLAPHYGVAGIFAGYPAGYTASLVVMAAYYLFVWRRSPEVAAMRSY